LRWRWTSEGRRLADLPHDLHGVVVHGVVLLVGLGGAGGALLGGLRGDGGDVVGLPLLAEVLHHAVDLVVADERPVHAGDVPGVGQVQAVPSAEQRLGADLVEDGAGVGAGPELERDAGGEGWT
jgi:hypothetical protein